MTGAGVVDPIGAAAEVLVRFSDRGWVRLLTEHRDDGSGHCEGCGISSPMWPCSLYVIAQRAKGMADTSRRDRRR